MSILDSAKIVRYTWPDWSEILFMGDTQKWVAYTKDCERVGQTLRESIFDTPEAAAQALAGIGQGPASVRSSPQ